MNISDIKIGETYCVFFYSKEGWLRHVKVKAVAINEKSVRVIGLYSGAKEFRVEPSSIDNRNTDAFDG